MGLMSDEILQRAFQENRSLTDRERHDLREAYLWEQAEDEKGRNKLVQSVKEFQGDQGKELPRHRVNCPSFVECPIDYKCRNFNPSNQQCWSCELYKSDDVCLKPEIHNDKNFQMIFSRERIDLDDE